MLVASLISLLAFIPPAGSDAPAPPPRMRLGLVTGDGPEGTRLADVLAAEGTRRGYEIAAAPPEIRSQGQKQACAWLLDHGVKALIARPASEGGWNLVLAEADRRAVPVIAINAPMLEEPIADEPARSDEKPMARTVRLTADFQQQGDAAGRWMLRTLRADSSVIELRGRPGETCTIERQAGFTAALATTRSIRLIATLAAEPTQDERLRRLLEKPDSKVEAVFAHDVRVAKMAARAIGELPDTKIRLVWIDEGDGGPDVLHDVDGATIESNPPVERVLFDAIDRWRLGVRLPAAIPLRTVVIERRKIAPPTQLAPTEAPPASK